MIGYLEGQPKIFANTCVILTHGVGYQVELTAQTISTISGQDSISLFIHTHVREDALELYGFLHEDEKKLFEALLNVSGVGPRSALALTGLGATKLIQAVQEADISILTQVPRVGKKLAQKIVIDLKSKLGSLKELDLRSPSPAKQELIEALTGMGFSEEMALKAIDTIDVEALPIEAAITQSLRLLGQRS